MYVCRICKHGPPRSHNPSGGSGNSCSPIQTSSGGIKEEDIFGQDNSLEAMDVDIKGMGRGKPMAALAQGSASAFPGKKRRFGIGRPPGGGVGTGAGRGFNLGSGSSPTSSLKPGAASSSPQQGQPSTTAAAAIASKKRGKDRKKGRIQSGVSKIRGMVGLQVNIMELCRYEYL